VYAVEKDSLKICLNGRADGVKERPQAFSVKDHPARRLLSFERVKADAAGQGTGFIGLVLNYDKKREEVTVAAALDGSPAKKAGLSTEDVLIAVNGTAVTNLRSAVEGVRQAKPRSELVLRVRRGGKVREVKVQVALLPLEFMAGLE
jgi:S1-C subfamily serine protease